MMENEKKLTSMEIAYNRILRKIMEERLKPGTPLREDHLAAEFGLSSTPVREAFRRLEHDGWIQSVPYRGSFLREFTPEEVEDLYLFREAIETIAVSQAMQKALPEDWKKIEDSLDAEKKYVADVKAGRAECSPTFDADLDFHSALVAAAHSTLLSFRNATLRAQLNSMAMSKDLTTTPEGLESVYEEHRMICQAMRRGWKDAAESLIRRHIAQARERHMKAFRPDSASR